MTDTRHSPAPSSGAWPIFNCLRACHGEFGLSKAALRSLQAILSFMVDRARPVIHASNAAICERAAISERTLRRHISEICDAGLMRRVTSANGKRFRLKSPFGEDLTFGLDLGPFLRRASEIEELAAQQGARKAQAHLVKHRILAHLRASEAQGAPVDTEVRRVLRRNLDLRELQELERALAPLPCPQPLNTPDMTAAAGQNDRLHQRSMKEDPLMKGIEMEESRESAVEPPTAPSAPSREQSERSPTGKPSLTLDDVRILCPDAMAFAPEPISSAEQLLSFSWLLGKMLGISEDLLRQASLRIGRLEASLTILAIVQKGTRIRNAGGYFRSLTLGPSSDSFCPFRLIRQCGAHQPS